MHFEKRFFALAATAVALVQACSEPADDAAAPAADAPAAPSTTAAPAPAVPHIQRQIDAARADLAKARGVDPADLSVTRALAVTWASGALGCPEPDMNYTMALVPGVLIQLSMNGKTYQYHAGQNSDPFLCPPERVEAPATGQGQDVM